MFKDRTRNKSFNMKKLIKNRRFSQLINKPKNNKNRKKSSFEKIKVKSFKTVNQKNNCEEKLRETEPFKFYFPKSKCSKNLKKLISETDNNLNDLSKEINTLDQKFNKINKQKKIEANYFKYFDNNIFLNKYLLEKDKAISLLKMDGNKKNEKIEKLEKENNVKNDKLINLEKKNKLLEKKYQRLLSKNKKKENINNGNKKIETKKEDLNKKNKKIAFFLSELEKKKSTILDLEYNKNLNSIELKNQKSENTYILNELNERSKKICYLEEYKKSMDIESKRLLNLVDILKEEMNILRIKNKETFDILSK